MDLKYLGVIIGVVVGFLSGAIGMYFYADNQLSSINDQSSSIFDSLNGDYTTLEASYNDLKAEYENLTTSYDNLSKTNSGLTAERNMYSDKYNEINTEMKQVSNDLYNYKTILDSCSDTEGALHRALGLSEIQKVGSKVTEVTMGTEKRWLAYTRLNDFILNHISTVKDVPFPCITNYTYLSRTDGNLIIGLETGSLKYMMQTPAFTLNNGQGDSDDKAVLECAMIQFYDYYIVDNQTKVYYCVLSFSDGSRHSFVIVPDLNGLICILDPAGNYVTSDNGWVNTDTAYSELNYYKEHWASKGYYITNIQLYEVRSVQGYFKLASDSDLQGTIDFLSTM